MLSQIYLIRHAAPDRASGIAYNVPPGPPLTPAGLQEASQAAEWLALRPPQQIFSSPFLRTATTSEIIADRLRLPLTYVEALREGSPGESREAIRARIGELLTQLDDGPISHVALVSHGICILTLLQITTNDTIDLSAHRYDYGNHAPTAGIWQGVRHTTGWRWDLVFRPSDVVAV
ncbi:MAG TPA: histidine phosphatase family protein [Roseiflexaceae bacterium]|nr:histidine phosphatase family protein [Roseiflexaceae bacterium]HMP41794.1 histidine phosphatase family protein [Roseiflexaceae bacterium]